MIHEFTVEFALDDIMERELPANTSAADFALDAAYRKAADALGEDAVENESRWTWVDTGWHVDNGIEHNGLSVFAFWKARKD